MFSVFLITLRNSFLEEQINLKIIVHLDRRYIKYIQIYKVKYMSEPYIQAEVHEVLQICKRHVIVLKNILMACYSCYHFDSQLIIYSLSLCQSQFHSLSIKIAVSKSESHSLNLSFSYVHFSCALS